MDLCVLEILENMVVIKLCWNIDSVVLSLSECNKC